ncbi:hypothetical protein [Glycomyces sp. NPDC021274]|uniref:hypothetical protein n=1 Tax=Glycomyces sp. NPDC021274 TaxID=3155120 RepID=UPI0033E39ACF
MSGPFTDHQRERLKAAQELASTMPIRLADAVTAVNQLCENHMDPQSADDLVTAAHRLRAKAPRRVSFRARIATTARIWRALR